MMSEQPCAACGTTHGAASVGPNTDLVDLLRHAFHHVLAPKLARDPTYTGEGADYELSVSYNDTAEDVIGLFLNWVGDGDRTEDAYTLTDSTPECLEAMAPARGLVYFSFDQYWDHYGLEAVDVLERAYIYVPPDWEVDGHFVRAWEPAKSEQAFEHAFVGAYKAIVDFNYCPPFKPAYSGYDAPQIADVGVEIPLLAEAIRQSANTYKVWETVIWEIRDGPSSPPTAGITDQMGLPAASVEAALAIVAGSNSEVAAEAAAADRDVQLGLIGIYLRVNGIADQKSELGGFIT